MKRQKKLNIHIIFESLLVLSTKISPHLLKLQLSKVGAFFEIKCRVESPTPSPPRTMPTSQQRLPTQYSTLQTLSCLDSEQIIYASCLKADSWESPFTPTLEVQANFHCRE